MNTKIKELLKDSLIVKITQGFIVTSFIFLAIIILKWQNLPPELPLYYSLPKSPDLLANPLEFLILPILSVLIFLIHFILAVRVNEKEKLAAKILMISALVVSITLLLTFIKIIFLVA